MSEWKVGDRVEICLSAPHWQPPGWHAGVVIDLEPYTQHRSFYWVRLDCPVVSSQGVSTDLISVLNPAHIRAPS